MCYCKGSHARAWPFACYGSVGLEGDSSIAKRPFDKTTPLELPDTRKKPEKHETEHKQELGILDRGQSRRTA